MNTQPLSLLNLSDFIINSKKEFLFLEFQDSIPKLPHFNSHLFGLPIFPLNQYDFLLNTFSNQKKVSLISQFNLADFQIDAFPSSGIIQIFLFKPFYSIHQLDPTNQTIQNPEHIVLYHPIETFCNGEIDFNDSIYKNFENRIYPSQLSFSPRYEIINDSSTFDILKLLQNLNIDENSFFESLSHEYNFYAMLNSLGGHFSSNPHPHKAYNFLESYESTNITPLHLSKIGGYPNFIQHDERSSQSLMSYLLLQLSSIPQMSFGNDGNLQFFINPDSIKDLHNFTQSTIIPSYFIFQEY